MKPETPLLECFAKIEWAETEINKLAPRLNDLLKIPIVRGLPPISVYTPSVLPIGLNKLTSQIDVNGIEVWRLVAPNVPSDFNVTVGSILHNLRSPLDQMLSALTASPEGVAFPFGRTRDEFETALGKQVKLPADARKMIEILKPYRDDGGNKLLFALNAINRGDKHRPGLVPINLQTSINLDTIITRKGAILTLGPRSGLHLVSDMNLNFRQSNVAKAPIAMVVGGQMRTIFGSEIGSKGKDRITIIYNQMGTKAPKGFDEFIAKAKLPPNSPKDDMEIATTLPGTKFEAEFYPSFNVALSNIEGFEREPVVAVLHKMRQLVERTLLTFRDRFFR
jgi:hypothetical protein